MISMDQVKELREKTGISVMQCRKALEQAEGDMDKAMQFLKEKSVDIASKKGDRELTAGAIGSYVHSSGNIGAMVLLMSETDFVSKNKEFVDLAKDIAMQVAAFSPEDNVALLAQQYIKNPEQTITDLITAAIQKFGEKIEVARFSRFSALEK
jgi:elongation factor Ts